MSRGERLKDSAETTRTRWLNRIGGEVVLVTTAARRSISTNISHGKKNVQWETMPPMITVNLVV